jgi:hypothetical protein
MSPGWWERDAMKFTVDVDCTPQEARAFLGLPDMESVHEAYLGRVKEAMRDGITPAMVQDMLKSWSPMGEGAMKLWQGLFDGMTRGGGGKSGS